MMRRGNSGFIAILIFIFVIIFPSIHWADDCSSNSSGCSACDVLRPDLFEASKKIVIIPFVPGPHVFADENANHAALLIVQGMAKEFKRSGRLDVLGDASADQADLIVMGQLDELRQEKSWKRFLLKKPKQVLAVHGKIVYQKDSSVVSVFSLEKKSLRSEGADSRAVAAELGGKIARCVMAMSKQNANDQKGEIQ